MPEPADFDAVVIGGGSAGFAAARTAAAAGTKVALVDGAAELGGLCILRGCMPSKTLLQTAEVRHLAQRAGVWGIQIPRVDFDWPAILRRKNELVSGWAGHRRDQLKRGDFTLIRATARFADAYRLALSNGKTIAARQFVIATGSVVSAPPLPDLYTVGYITSDDALNLPKLPRSLIVLGGGPVALELGQFFARLDVAVSVVQRSEHVLRDFDTDAATALEIVLRREGLRVFTGTRLVGARKNAAGKSVSFEHGDRLETVTAEEILLALGRSPNTAGLDLNRAGVKTEHGRIVTNLEQQSSMPHIYAAGDCCGLAVTSPWPPSKPTHPAELSPAAAAGRETNSASAFWCRACWAVPRPPAHRPTWP